MKKPKTLGVRENTVNKKSSKKPENNGKKASKKKKEPKSVLEELRNEKGLTQTQICQIIGGMTEDSYRKYENNPELTPTSILIDMSHYYDKSVDYLLGLTEYSHVGNEEIHDMTGLSDGAIEVLRHINDNLDTSGAKIIKLINIVLERSTVKTDIYGKSVFNIFSLIYDYIFGLKNVRFARAFKDNEELKDLVIKIERENKRGLDDAYDYEITKCKQLLSENNQDNIDDEDLVLMQCIKDDGDKDYIFIPNLYDYKIKTEIDMMLEDYKYELNDNEIIDLANDISDLTLEMKYGIDGYISQKYGSSRFQGKYGKPYFMKL